MKKRIGIGKETEIANLVCVECGKVFELASPVGDDPERTPQPGNISICIDCGHIAIFTDDMKFREPTVDETIEISRDSTVVALQMARVSAHKTKP